MEELEQLRSSEEAAAPTTSELSLVRPEQRPGVLRAVLRGPARPWRRCSGAPCAPGGRGPEAHT